MTPTEQRTPSPPFKLDANALAEDRTRLASERTLMAWVRTSISLLGFGFTVYKFLEFEAAKDPVLGVEGPLLHALRGPRNFALTFIVLAIVSLGIAVIQHWQYTKNLDPVHGRRFDLTLVTAGFVAVIGILSLMSLLFKIGPF